MIAIAASMDMIGRAVRCELDELGQLRFPAILHWGMQHYVVLEGFKYGRAIIHDPAIGRLRIDIGRLSRSFTGIALELSTAPEFKKRRAKSPLSLLSWFRLAPSMYGSLGQVLLLSLILQLYVLAAPLYMQMAIDQGALKGDRGLLTTLALGFGLFAVFNAIAGTLRDFVAIRLTALLNWDMTLRLFRHLIRLPLPWFQRRKLADILSRFDSIDQVRDLISGGLISTLIDGLLALLTMTMMFVFLPSLAIVAASGFVVYSIIRLCSLPIIIRFGMETLAAHITENGKRIESIRAIQSIKVMGAEKERESDWANLLSKFITKEQRQNKFNSLLGALHNLCEALIHVLLIYIGAQAVIDGRATVGLLFAFMSYQTQFSTRAGALFEQVVHWKMTDMYSYRLADIVLAPKEIGLDESPVEHISIKGNIELCNVGFAYTPQDPFVFRGISLTIHAGEFIAVTGPSGAGKSTLLKVVCGLYPATVGEVKFDGKSLNSWGVNTIRQSLGVVLQDDELLSGTIAENVAFFDENIQLDWVLECLRLASIDDDIMAMPMRTETHIGDMGSTLSGGQKQRLLLARAIYRRPRILILDEATCHLDLNRESEINAVLKAMGITRIIVAHRPETIASADRVVLIMNGAIVADSCRTISTQ